METKNHSLIVGVFAPYLQGFYYGELISQIQQLCMVKGYRFSLMSTGGLGEYQMPIGINHLDVAIILRNAVHPALVKRMLDMEISVVSISFDYFPLSVPVVESDNEFGVELAFNHLIKKGHQKIAFVGDISQYDLRKRYEAFCDQYEINAMSLDDRYVFIVKNAQFSGGYEAVNEYIRRDCDATGVICAAGLTGIGFAQKLMKTDLELYNSVEVVAFDAISLFPVLVPDISIIDQNTYLMANKALEVGEKQRAEILADRHHYIQPKLLDASSDRQDAEQAFLATSVELSELHNANYMKSITNCFSEWTKNIGESRLSDIMMLAPLFPRHIHEVLFSRITSAATGDYVARLSKHLSYEGSHQIDENIIWDIEHYPQSFGRFRVERYTSSIHIPIIIRNTVWGILSVYGENKHSDECSSMASVCGFLHLVVDYLKLEIFSKIDIPKQAPRQKQTEIAEQEVGEIRWDVSQSLTVWDSNALAMLGYTSSLEQNVYKYMELADRVHVDSEEALKEIVEKAADAELQTTLKLRCKSKAYELFYIHCHQKVDTDELILKLYQSEDYE